MKTTTGSPRTCTLCRSGRVPDLLDSPVRAPIPVKRDRLYGEADDYALAYMRAAGMRQQNRETGAFNDFE